MPGRGQGGRGGGHMAFPGAAPEPSPYLVKSVAEGAGAGERIRVTLGLKKGTGHPQPGPTLPESLTSSPPRREGPASPPSPSSSQGWGLLGRAWLAGTPASRHPPQPCPGTAALTSPLDPQTQTQKRGISPRGSDSPLQTALRPPPAPLTAFLAPRSRRPAVCLSLPASSPGSGFDLAAPPPWAQAQRLQTRLHL